MIPRAFNGYHYSMNRRTIAYTFLLLTLIVPNSFALVKLAIVGSGTKTTTVDSSQTFVPDGWGYGGGALLSLMFVQVGAIYKVQKVQTVTYSSGVNNNWTAERKEIEVPLVFRKSFLHFFSFGFGGYYSKVLSVSASFARGRSTTRTAADGGNFKKADYGAVGRFALEVPLGGIKRLLLDTRYNYGFAKVKTREIQGLVGLSWGI